MRVVVYLVKLLVPERIRNSRLFAKFIFLPSLTYNVIATKLTDREWYTRIDETIILGALPFASVVEQLVANENVKAVVSLNEDFELNLLTPGIDGWKKCGVQFFQLPTQDIFASPDIQKVREAVKFIQRFEAEYGSVYVHCKAGRTRSATVVGCYLMEKHGWSPEYAVEHMISKRKQVLLDDAQWQTLLQYFNTFINSVANRS